MVAVHGPVAAAKTGDFSDATAGDCLLNLAQVSRRTFGGGVATIGNGMDRDATNALLGGPLQEPAEMVDMAMDATIGTESDQMQGASIALQGLG